jgi:hypothetical protein
LALVKKLSIELPLIRVLPFLHATHSIQNLVFWHEALSIVFPMILFVDSAVTLAQGAELLAENVT